MIVPLLSLGNGYVRLRRIDNEAERNGQEILSPGKRGGISSYIMRNFEIGIHRFQLPLHVRLCTIRSFSETFHREEAVNG